MIKNRHQKNQGKAYFFAVLSVLFWSTAASAFKLTLEHLNFIQIVFLASVTSTLILFAILLIQGKITELSLTSRRDLANSAFLGFLNPFLYYVVLLKAYSILPAQIAQPLNFTWPIMLVLLSIPLLKQKISAYSLFAMLISFSGVYLISSEGNPFDMKFSDPLGVSLALGSSVIWALFWIYNVRDQRSEVIKLFLNFLFASFFAVILMLFTSGFERFPLYGLLGGAYIGAFEMGITFVFWLKALQFSESTDRVSNLIYLTPFFALLLISLILGEKIHTTTVMGLLFIIGGIFIQKKINESGPGKSKERTV